ncbi:MAG: ZIP family metal transporter [Candidatus Asgardarchaeia archaeon]
MLFIDNIILIGFFAGLLAGLATGVGAIPVLFLNDVSPKLLDSLLGFAAGVMLAASVFSLIIPSLEIGGVCITSIGIITGAIFVHLLDRYVPHFHFIYGPEGPTSSLKKIWLFIFAITIHNFPEGLAVGVSFGLGDLRAAIVVATAIGLQNMPEGLGVALPLRRENYSRKKSFGIATLTGLVEPVAALIGVTIVTVAHAILPLALSFAAGAMIFVISDEIIPESHRKGFEREATFGLMAGFILMMILDNYFG